MTRLFFTPHSFFFRCSAKQLGYLEKLHPGETPFFGGPKRVAGAFALACIFDILVSLEPKVLDATPKLKSFYAAMMDLPAFAEIKNLGDYFKRETVDAC